MTAAPHLSSRGRVALVGAGPGDPELLTLRGAELLAAADVVVHDRLIDPDLLERARRAERIDVGKRPHGPSFSQAAINALLVERARNGALVVRLKGGDPFVFGRGSEEAEACREAGIPCEVVPGVTSAIAAAAAIGIPVTERGVARSLAIVTPSVGEGEEARPLDYAALAKLDTIVVLMGVERIGEVAAGLLAAGMDAKTPAAVVERGTWRAQRDVRAALGDVAAAAAKARIAAPAVLVVGEVARRRTSGRESTTLVGCRVLVTRPPSASKELVRALRDRGADVIDAPLIRVRYLPAERVPRVADYQWIVLTSLHAVRGLARLLDASALDVRALAGPAIAAVGPKTGGELRRALGIAPDVVPNEHRATALLAALATRCRPGDRVLFPCGTLAREETAAGLRSLGCEVDEVRVYATESEPPSETCMARASDGLDAVLLYSPSAVRSLIEHQVPIGDAAILCVGPTTAAEVRDAGLGEPIVAEEYGDQGVLAALESVWTQRVAAQGAMR